MRPLLLHVVAELCDDPDCEVHNIEVGLDEGTVTQESLAFYIAGAHAMEIAIRKAFPRKTDGREELIAACLEAGRPILGLADRFA
jgi:hypothetical protein